MSERPIGTCEICGNHNVALNRKYFYYVAELPIEKLPRIQTVNYCCKCQPVVSKTIGFQGLSSSMQLKQIVFRDHRWWWKK